MTSQVESLTQSKKMTLPGPPGFPLLGNMPFFTGKSPYKTFMKLAQEYGDVFQIRMGTRPAVVINGLEAIRQARKDDFTGRPNFFMFRRAATSLAMAGTSGEAWKRHREVAASAMNEFLANKKGLIEQKIIEEIDDLAEVWVSYNGQPFDPRVDIGIAIINITFKLTFGTKNTLDKGLLSKLLKNLRFVTKGPNVLISDLIPKPSLVNWYIRSTNDLDNQSPYCFF